jgi:hypothetical protein
MSLEEALRENTEVMKENASLMREILSRGKSPTGTADKPAKTVDEEAGAEKPKKGTKAKAEAAPKGPTATEAAQQVSDWIGEVEIEVDDDGEPTDTEENQKALRRRNNRKAFIKTCLEKIGAKKVTEIEKTEDVVKLLGWMEQKKGGTDPFKDDET